jgi:SAM-dependent methyltransferase
VGLDLSPDMLAKAGRRGRRQSFEAALVCANAQHLPFRDGTFESVVSTFAMNAVPQLETALGEMLRVVEDGGSLAFISVGDSESGGLGSRLVAGLWRREGDIIRDEVGALRQLGVEPRREDFGPCGTIHLITVVKASKPGPQPSWGASLRTRA